MSGLHSQRDTEAAPPAQFTTTHWSVVMAAGDSSAPGGREALENLCRAYWFPIYAYVRRKGRSPEEAQDCTQAFFARLLEKNYLKFADRERGRFRAFLLTSLSHFLINEWRRDQAAKNGGGLHFISLGQQDAEGRYRAEPASADLAPDKLFERRWALALLEQVLARLRTAYEGEGKEDLFDSLRPFVWGERSALSQAEVGVRLGMSENAVAQAVCRLRQRYGVLLRTEIAHTVSAPGDVEEELRHLLRAISG